MKIYTKKGDDGSTGLLYGGRVSKDDIRTDTYGSLDEAVAAMGLARGLGLAPRTEEIVVRLQREMFVAGAQLATAAENQDRLAPGVSRVSMAMTQEAEANIDELVGAHPLAEEFILPGATPGAAALDLARSILRRAERGAVTMDRQGMIDDPEVLRYLNRASDLLFALSRFEEGEQGKRAEPSRT